MANDVLAGCKDFSGGQNASLDKSRLPENQYAAGINVSTENGILSPRWGLTQRNLNFPDGGVTNPISRTTVSYEEIFYSGRFQALINYTIGTVNYLVIVVSGVIYLVDIVNFNVTIMTLENDDYLNQNTPRLAWSPAGQYWVIFDYPNFPVILDGLVARRADPALNEVPISVLGAYNQNRLAIANAANEFTLGDPAGSLATPYAPITFNEILVPSSAYVFQSFQLPTGLADGPITAMGFLQFVDTSTGIGPLIVATANSIFSFQTQLKRVDWDNGTFGTSFIATSGVAGSRALINVNTDLFFTSPDGEVRTASMSRLEQQKWSKTPISREVKNWIRNSTPYLSGFTTMGYFRNKVFVSVNPFQTVSYGKAREPLLDVAFGGFIVLELDNLAVLGKDGNPTWAGLWTGVRPMDIISSNKRCFVISKDPASRNELYEYTPEKRYDVADGHIRQVTGTIYTKQYDGENPWQDKTLNVIDVGLQNIQGDFEIKVSYRPSQAANFALWGTKKHLAPWRDCKVPSGCLVRGFAPHQFQTLIFGDALEAPCDPVNQTTGEVFREIQLKFEITGINWELSNFLLRMVPQPQANLTTACNETVPAAVCTECNTDWNIGVFESCQSLKT